MNETKPRHCEKCNLELIGDFPESFNCAKYCCKCCPSRVEKPCLPEMRDGTFSDKMAKFYKVQELPT